MWWEKRSNSGLRTSYPTLPAGAEEKEVLAMGLQLVLAVAGGLHYMISPLVFFPSNPSVH